MKRLKVVGAFRCFGGEVLSTVGLILDVVKRRDACVGCIKRLLPVGSALLVAVLVVAMVLIDAVSIFRLVPCLARVAARVAAVPCKSRDGIFLSGDVNSRGGNFLFTKGECPWRRADVMLMGDPAILLCCSCTICRFILNSLVGDPNPMEDVGLKALLGIVRDMVGEAAGGMVTSVAGLRFGSTVGGPEKSCFRWTGCLLGRLLFISTVGCR